MNTEQNILQVAIEDIIPNRFQPRLAFDEEGLKELSESIKQHGIIQPLVLRRLGDKYEIIAGERRFKAATLAGLRTVPAIISNIDDNQSAEVALVENIQRRNLTPIEEAKSYKNLLDRGYMTQDQLAEKMGVSQSSIANKLRLLNLVPEVQNALLEGKISERHARSLLTLPKEEQTIWLKKILDKRMTVRRLDLEIKNAKGDLGEDIPLVNSKPNIEEIMNQATDINVVPLENNVNEIKANIEEPVTLGSTVIPNKFFNFLEDEAANMNIPITPKEEDSTPIVEVLDDFEDSKPIKEDPIELSKVEDPEIPNFFAQKEQNNTIEEVKEENIEKVIDPMDYVMQLDPNYKQILEEEKGLDLKTAINQIRELVNTMQNAGFQMSLDEIDFNDNYQMTINIKKNDE